MARLRPSDFKKIFDLVTEVESRTTAEIVPLILDRSADYGWVQSTLTLQGGLFGAILAWIWNFRHAWPVPASECALLVGGGALLGFALSFLPFLARFSIGRERLDHAVGTRLHAEFVKQGCTETVGRTGILILVSLFEKRIQILADIGIQKKMIEIGGEKIWETFCTGFANSAKKGEAVEGLARVIRELCVTLEKQFPDDGSEKNQLRNELRTDKE